MKFLDKHYYKYLKEDYIELLFRLTYGLGDTVFYMRKNCQDFVMKQRAKK